MIAIIPAADSTLIVNEQNPWPGLLPFTEEMAAFFHGRDEDAEGIVKAIHRMTLTVLYGKSGLGKTSLLRARVFPLLRKDEFVPVYIRLRYSGSDESPVEQIKAILESSFQAAGVDVPAVAPGQSLWEYFFSRKTEFWKDGFQPVTPVLVFDQFEELFTIGRAREETMAAGRRLIEELGALIENRPPPAVKARMDENPAEAVNFNQEQRRYKVVICLREDYLAELEHLAHSFPSLRHNRVTLRALNGAQAQKVILGGGEDIVEPEIVPQIVRFVAGASSNPGGNGNHELVASRLEDLEIEPALLSLFCRELNNQRLARGMQKITSELLSTTEGREILLNYYESAVGDLPLPARHYLEDNLVTVDGFRDSVDLGNALHHGGLNQCLVDTLVERRLIRIEEHAGSRRIELTHDVITGLVRASRVAREAQEARDKAKREKLEADERVERERRDAEARDRIRQAQLKNERWRTRQARLAGVVFLLVACVAVISLWIAYSAYKRVKKTESALQEQVQEKNAALQSVAGAAQVLIDQVIKPEVGIPPQTAWKLLKSAEDLYTNVDVLKVTDLPELEEGKAALRMAYAELYTRTPPGTDEEDCFRKALKEAETGIDLARQLSGIAPSHLAGQNKLAAAWLMKGRVLMSRANAIATRELSSAAPAPNSAPAGSRQQLSESVQAVYHDAFKAFQKSFDILNSLLGGSAHEEHNGPDPQIKVAQAQNWLGDVRRKLGEIGEAQAHYDKAFGLASSLAAGEYKDRSSVKELLADCHNKLGNIYNEFADDSPTASKRESELKSALGEYRVAYDLRKALAKTDDYSGHWHKLALSCANCSDVIIKLAELNGKKRANPTVNFAAALQLMNERVGIHRNLLWKDPSNFYWRQALAEGYYNIARHLQKDVPERKEEAFDAARRAAAITMERDKKYLLLYAEVLKSFGDKQKKELQRVQEVLDSNAAR